MAEIGMTAKGVNGQIDVSGDRITIRRKGGIAFFTQGLKGDKDILISQISSIQFKKAGALTNGYIQFGFLGGTESKGGLQAAIKDENSVVFKRGNQQRSFEAVKEYVEAAQQRLSASNGAAPASSNLDELQKLADLKAQGIVTDEEFEEKKRQLLEL